MKKMIPLICLAVGMMMLTACGSQYDDEINQVLDLENKKLDDPAIKTDIDTLQRDDTKIWVYNDGEYIKIQYVIRGENETNDPLYKYNDKKKQYEDYMDGDFDYDDADDLEPDYTENVNDDNS